MRILHWIEGYRPLIGGAQRMAELLADHQLARGHEIVVVTDRTSDRLAPIELRGRAAIHRFPFFRALQTSDGAAIRACADGVADLKRSFQPDVVHVHFSGVSAWFHLLTQSAHQTPMLVTMHILNQDVHPDLALRILRAADWITTVSASQLPDLAGLDGSLRDKSSLLYNGLPLPHVPPSPLRFVEPTLLCIGRVVPEKGFDVAVAAFALVAPRWPKLRMIVAGDGSARRALERLAADLKVSDRIEFRGWVPPDAVPSLINETVAVLVPSRWQEPFGLVAVQAAQMGRPVVASRVGGLQEVVVDHETGLLVAPDDRTALAAAVDSLLGAPEDAIRLGARARDRALALFSLDRCAEEFERIYARLSMLRGAASAGGART